MVLIGGTSNTGKSTVARLVADRLGFECRSTDELARHPGRPWPTPTWEVPVHVAEHYRSLTVEELIASVLDHHGRLWPRIEELVTARAAQDGGTGLVLEGSALRPAAVARLAAPRTAAVWLTADEDVLRDRMHAACRYAEATADGRYLVDKFLARAVRFQELMVAEACALGLECIDTGGGRSAAEVADAVRASAVA
ncbi:hypothetical protein OG550_09505 [Kitasatospora sp. NBC_00458]